MLAIMLLLLLLLLLLLHFFAHCRSLAIHRRCSSRAM
jgi:hypothetical protein